MEKCAQLDYNGLIMNIRQIRSLTAIKIQNLTKLSQNIYKFQKYFEENTWPEFKYKPREL